LPFLLIATVTSPRMPIAIAGPIVLLDRKDQTANTMQSSPIISRSFLMLNYFLTE
jgi:hypothetical protein